MNDLIVGIMIAFSAALFGAVTLGVGWITKQVTEHAKWMAVANQRLAVVEADVAAIAERRLVDIEADVNRHDGILIARPPQI